MFHRIVVGAVDAGREYKALVIRQLQQQNISCITLDYNAYPDIGRDSGIAVAAAVAGMIAEDKADGGIIIDDCGLDASITANKFKGVRASRCTSVTTARYTRCHNASNVLCIGYGSIGLKNSLDIVKTWITNEFEGGRHAISVNLIRTGEEMQFNPEKDVHRETEDWLRLNGRWPLEKVYIANDHAGFGTKEFISRLLAERHIPVVDMGTGSTEIVRYPYYAARIADKIKQSSHTGGILICGTGIGMSIAVNKFKGIRAALCTDKSSARYAREHLDANVLCIGGKIVGQFEIEDIVNTWLDTGFMEELKGNLSYLEEIEDRNLAESDWKPVSNV